MEAVTEKEERGAESVQRWTAKRRSALVLSILRGETSAQEAARKHGLTVAKIEWWQERYLLAAENALRSRPRDEEVLKDEQIKKLKQKIGDLVTDVAPVTPATLFFSPRSIRFSFRYAVVPRRPYRSSPSFCGKLRTLAPNA